MGGSGGKIFAGGFVAALGGEEKEKGRAGEGAPLLSGRVPEAKNRFPLFLGTLQVRPDGEDGPVNRLPQSWGTAAGWGLEAV